MKKLVVVIIILFASVLTLVKGQGYNHQWLLGSYDFFPDPKGRILFDSSNYTLVNENRKMPFYGTQGNICDANGDLLMSSNGIWIANALGDTMQNGSELNPSIFTNSWPNGIPIGYGNVFLPYPGDTNKFVLFHKTLWAQLFPAKMGIYKSEIDILLDGGLGGVVNKNDTLIVDTLSWGLGACRHANGRDWWIVVVRDFNPLVYTILLTPLGVDTIFTQSLGFSANTYGNVSQLIFSPEGEKFIYCTPINQTPSGTVLISNFDRCSGQFSNVQIVPISTTKYLLGLSFSPSGKYAYACTSNNIYQIDIDSLTVNSIASYDGFISPGPNCCATSFWNMYLAANGKIYITSGSSVQHLHEMNNPDSAGLACDVQQHAISLGYAQLRAVPNHPNYYLGPVIGSVCDSLTGINEHLSEIQNFTIRPNPNNGNFNISYLLPQTATGGKSGWFEVYDVMGKKVYNLPLPPWSTLQNIQLPNLSDGVYYGVIRSGYNRVSRKIVVMKD